MASEITDEPSCFLETEAQKLHVLRIINYQKSLYYSSTSSSNSLTSVRSFSSTCSKSSTLLDMLKEGSTRLGRLFAMEHTSLETHMRDYSASPVFKPILLWGSDTDDENVHDDPWSWLPRKQSRRVLTDYRGDEQSDFGSDKSIRNSRCEYPRMFGNRRLIRTRKFRSCSRFRLSKQHHGAGVEKIQTRLVS